MSLWTKDTAVGAVKAFHAEHGYQPTSSEAGVRYGLPAYSSAVRLFGSWNGMIEAAGFRPYPSKSSSQARTMVRQDRNPRGGKPDGKAGETDE